MRYLIILALITWVGFAQAEDFVEHQGSEYKRCHSSVDVTKHLADPNDYKTIKPGVFLVPNCSAILIPQKYRKIDRGIVVEMNQTEKDAVDAPEQAAAARQSAIEDEQRSNDFCRASFEEISSRIDSANLDNPNMLKAVIKKIARCYAILRERDR